MRTLFDRPAALFVIALGRRRRRRTPFSITRARWSAARCRPRRMKSSLSFTQNLEPAFSTVEVTDANGARVDQGKASDQRQHHAGRAEAARPGQLQSALARAVGRYPHHAGQLHLPRRRPVTGGRTMTWTIFDLCARHSFCRDDLAAGVVFFIVFIAAPALLGATDDMRRRLVGRGSLSSPGSAWLWR